MNDTIDALRTPLLLAATVAAGLQAGTYYAFSCGVIPGLARGDDRTFVATMQQINVAILNPVFLASFVGAPLLAALATASYVGRPGGSRAWVVAGLVLAVGTVVVTAAANVPLNDALAAAGEVRTIRDLAAVRADFESSWVRWNIVRTLTATASLGCLAWAAIRST